MRARSWAALATALALAVGAMVVLLGGAGGSTGLGWGGAGDDRSVTPEGSAPATGAPPSSSDLGATSGGRPPSGAAADPRSGGSSTTDLVWPASPEGTRGPDVPFDVAEPLAQVNVEIATLDARLALAQAAGADTAEIAAIERERSEAIARRDGLTSSNDAGSPPT